MNKKKTRKSQGKAIAIVEEMADNIYSIKFILQSLGFSVQSYSFRTRYLPELLATHPDLIVIDMMIPDGLGYGVIREIRLETGLKGVPILAITADAMPGSDKDVLSAGAQEVLTKPYAVTELRAKLDKLVGTA